ncbi:MAG: 3-octaprenyl-4-hydroxybenzoate carboxy-lyase [Betaproteobacteria bacterium RIFCSPLOWO2_12_FULL_68_19]|nr:MAG: 3-octaprenyl-4-hydroxybenzoate carboxy-lyase [Betaproteobacteria bacterium RIFCSPLOWO2_12_FULL_68_19]
MAREPTRLIVAITGASGAIYGIRLLEALRKARGVEVHLILSRGGKLTISVETGWKVKDVEAMAHTVHSDQDLAASISSGSFRTAGMIVAPCSIKTLSGIVSSYADNLVVRAADVVLKEGRKLVLMPRETPLHAGHCRLLLRAAEMGAVIAPPMPAFYNAPRSMDDLINHSIGRVLDLFGIESGLVKRWSGPGKPAGRVPKGEA